MTNFDFNDHRLHKKNYKTILRFVVYGIVIIVLFYLILNRSATSPSDTIEEIDVIDDVEIELFD
jgi:hypothetical protein